MMQYSHSNQDNLKSSVLEEVTTKFVNQDTNHKGSQSMTICKRNLMNMEVYETKLAAFCGVWEDHPRRQYRMEFRLEKGQLVGYSNSNQSKALASFDGHLLNMVIIHVKESEHGLNHYRGRLGWNAKYINWEKQDSSRENGWRPTRKWMKVE